MKTKQTIPPARLSKRKSSAYRVYALMVRHALPMKRDFDLLSDMLYWPLMDTITWGIASSWLAGSDSTVGSAVLSILIALVIWNVIWRAQSEVSRNLIDEIWNNNLVNVFSTALTLREWMLSVLLQSFLKMFISAGFVSLVILGLYAVNVYQIGWWLVPFTVNATLTGWSVGFVAAALVIRYGQKVQTVVWTLPGALFPLSAVYFPVDQLPVGLRQISQLVPTTYIFESMRSLLFTGTLDLQMLWLSFGLNAIYIVLALWFFVRMFRKSKELNLARFSN